MNRLFPLLALLAAAALTGCGQSGALYFADDADARPSRTLFGGQRAAEPAADADSPSSDQREPATAAPDDDADQH